MPFWKGMAVNVNVPPPEAVIVAPLLLITDGLNVESFLKGQIGQGYGDVFNDGTGQLSVLGLKELS